MYQILLLTCFCVSVITGPPTAVADDSRHRQDVDRLIQLATADANLPRSHVMLLGTFHFADAGLDELKPQHKVDVLGGKPQKEIADLVERLATFRPTKIGVEYPAKRQSDLDRRFKAFRTAQYRLTTNEIDQLGLRLAKKLDHERVFAIDAGGAWLEPRTDPEGYAKTHGQEARLNDPYEAQFFNAAMAMDELKMQRTLRETLLMHNDPRMIATSHGIYLTRVLSVGDAEHYPAVDGFRTHWYNRNLRIFANIQRITEGTGSRIIVIIGAGHLPILRHTVMTSPEFELIEVSDYLD